ncbi:MGMT family protein [Ornithinibacillus gellani]|uniref:MGMT family protein n=1 Tax=Ornithinibacillus gellani TaxID=2293253 RepID=UPI000F478D45|nr:MGMT family protein [Ornithinibacillus gellani]TQS74150.1 MGMT family protein [Ornithinibacillus gellani]
MQPFTKQVIQVIQQIPKGHVMSYGQVARTAGNPRAARQVSRILHSMSAKYDLPWQRVVNKEGRITLKSDAGIRQRDLLVDEGILFGLHGKIDMNRYEYIPEEIIHVDDLI